MREFEAKVLSLEGNAVVLDETVFHPRPHGGLDCDVGELRSERGAAKVFEAIARGEDVLHVVDRPELFEPGQKVRGLIDWDRRYKMMRLHTAAHIFISILHGRYGALVTGGHVSPDYSRDDFDLELEDWRAAVKDAIEEVNEVAAKCVDVLVKWVSREEALAMPGIVKLAERLPPNVDKLRLVEIPGIDVQADGGPHVRNTCEVGEIVLLKTESRGRRRKRVYYTLKELADVVKV
ncbi:MAG: alanyl-tRNA editing protein [Fervidicoccaceae archaeon]